MSLETRCVEKPVGGHEGSLDLQKEVEKSFTVTLLKVPDEGQGRDGRSHTFDLSLQGSPGGGFLMKKTCTGTERRTGNERNEGWERRKWTEDGGRH